MTTSALNLVSIGDALLPTSLPDRTLVVVDWHSHRFPIAFEKMNPHFVLYDDECPLCTFQMRLLSWLDWFNVLALVPLSDPRTKQIAPQLKRDDLLAAIHCVTPEGRIYRGARCLRFVGMRLPLLIPVALVLWIPGIIQIAELIYRWVSRNRLMLSRIFGCREACALLPPRPREQDKPI
jgi:predicted DCC family thiol-disulfide oxidoreductase YuxK